MSRIKFKPDNNGESSMHGASGTTPVYVLLDGERVAVVGKRTEWYGNLGHRGVRYTYFEFYRIDTAGKMVKEDNPEHRRGGGALASASTRKKSVAEGLVRLGYIDAAHELDHDTAAHYARRIAEES